MCAKGASGAALMYDPDRLKYPMKLVNGQWTKPEIPPFAKGLWTSSPVFSVDGTRLYFAAQRVFRSEDRGDSWTAIVQNLPGVLSVEVQTLP